MQNIRSAEEIGPSLPPGFLKAANTADEDEVTTGPKLPPQFEESSGDRVGPREPRSKSNTYGPALPPSFLSEGETFKEEEEEEEEEDVVIGPMPSRGEITVSVWVG